MKKTVQATLALDLSRHQTSDGNRANAFVSELFYVYTKFRYLPPIFIRLYFSLIKSHMIRKFNSRIWWADGVLFGNLFLEYHDEALKQVITCYHIGGVSMGRVGVGRC